MDFVLEHKKAFILGISLIIIILLGTLTYKAPNSVNKPQRNDNIFDNTISNEVISIDNNNMNFEKNDFEIADTVTNILGDTTKYSHLGKAFFEIVEDYQDDYKNIIKDFYTQATIKEGSSMLYLQESNYSQFNIPKTDSIVQPYDQPITISLAILNKNYLPEEEDATLEEKSRYLSKNINQLVEDYKEDLPGLSKNSKFHYKITGMTIRTEGDIRPRLVKVSINNQKALTFELDNTDRYQLLELNTTQNNISKPVSITITVTDTYNNSDEEGKELKIDEIRFGIESNIPQSGQE